MTRWTYPGPTNPYLDSISDDDIIGHLILQSGGWENPPDYLDGLTSLPGGMMVGWTGNTVHFCEPDRPHTWPSLYDQSVHYAIITSGGVAAIPNVLDHWLPVRRVAATRRQILL